MRLNAQLMKETLNKVISVVPTKAVLPILEFVQLHIKSNMLKVLGTNLEIFMEAKLKVNIDEPLNVCVEARRFKAILDMLGDKDFEIEFHNNNSASLSCGNVKHELRTEPSHEFPQYTRKESYEHSYPIDSFVTENIGKVLPFVSTDEMRVTMAGVFFDEGNIVGTDGFKLCVVNAGCAIEKLILRAPMAVLLQKFDTAILYYDNEDILVESDYLSMQGKTVEGTFPDYKVVIPAECKNELTLNRLEFMSAIKGVMLSVDKTTRRIVLQAENNNVVLSSKNESEGHYSEDVMPCRCTGDKLITGFNGDYLLTLLSTLKDETVKFEYNYSNTGFLAKNNIVTVLVMPVRVENAYPEFKFKVTDPEVVIEDTADESDENVNYESKHDIDVVNEDNPIEENLTEYSISEEVISEEPEKKEIEKK